METIWQTRWANHIREVRIAACDADHDLKARGVAERVRYAVQLVIEELMTNSIKYAFHDDEEHAIGLTMAVEDETVRITLTDDGDPFDPSCDPQNGLCRPIPKPSQGGMGIMMVRTICDSITYQRENGRNVVQVDIAARPERSE
ncbi:MAG: ATP-binding protein [Proteobacteria bacterium]|nr:ATP-binding protein [Pseudomonadota bacterium]MBU1612057.1 ATP-binding protein [Pseudomonadota bacterium]